MTRLWVGGSALKVQVDAYGMPQRLIWEGHTHEVQVRVNQWRVDVGWWRLRLWRDYYKVVTTTGLLVVLYHDLVRDEWYLQRMYD